MLEVFGERPGAWEATGAATAGGALGADAGAARAGVGADGPNSSASGAERGGGAVTGAATGAVARDWVATVGAGAAEIGLLAALSPIARTRF